MLKGEHEILWDYNAPWQEQKILAHYVLENLDEIAKLCTEAEQDLGQIRPWNDPSFHAYVGSDEDHVRTQVNALFQRLQKNKPHLGQDWTYRVEPPNSPPNQQRLRLVREIFHYGHSECLGWVLLFAACLLHVRLNPLILVTRLKETGDFHALLGYWLKECSFRQAVVDGRDVADYFPHDINVVNVTRIALDEYGQAYDFEAAQAEAHDALLPPNNPDWEILFAVDLRAARDAGIEALLPLQPWAGNHTLLPADAFQDRAELEALSHFWSDQEAYGTLALIGMGGAGKTALVHRFLAQLPGGMVAVQGAQKDEALPIPDGLFVWNFYARPDSEMCATALYNYVTGEQKRKATFDQVREVLDRQWRGCRILLVFDGLEKLQSTPGNTPEGSTFGQFIPEGLVLFLRWICDGPRPVRAMVTSRFGLTDLRRYVATGGYRSIDVGALSLESARALLRQRGVQGLDWKLDELIREFGSHAQTLDLLGNALHLFCDNDPLQARLLPPPEEVRSLPDVGEQAEGCLRVLHFYEKQLSPRELATLQRLCLFHIVPVTTQLLSDIFLESRTEGVAGALAGLTPMALRQCLLSLCGYHLVSGELQAGSQSFTVHPTVRAYFNVSIAHKETLHDGVRQYLASRTDADEFVYPFDHSHLDLLEELIYHSTRSQYVTEAFDVFLNKMGSYSHLASRYGAYSRGRRVVTLFWGEKDFDLSPHLGPQATSRLLNAYGGFCRELGDLGEAKRVYEYALRTAPTSLDTYNSSVALRNLPIVLLLQGFLKEGEQKATEAIAHAACASNGVEAQLISYGVRARLRSLLGDIRHALDDFHFAEGQEKPLKGLLGVWHADLLLRLGQVQEAARSSQQNLEDLENSGKWVNAIPRCGLILAEAARRQGALDRAHDFTQRALTQGVTTADQAVLTLGYLMQARLALDVNDLDRAERAIEEGLRIAEYCGYGLYGVDLLVVRGSLHLQNGDVAQAEADARQALDGKNAEHAISLLGARHPACGYIWGEGDALRLLGKALEKQGRREEAERIWQDYHALREQIQDD